jgi:hypothetical protein
MAASKRKGFMTMRSFRSFRSSIAATIGVMLVAALGVAAMRLASELLAGIMFLLTCGLLCLAFIAVFDRDSAERAWWLGFTVFGWIHHGLAFGWWWGEVRPWLPTTWVLEMLGMAAGLTVDRSRPLGFGEPWRSFLTAGQSLWTLLMAVTGGIVALLLVGDRTGKFEGSAAEPQTDVVALRRWWNGPVIVYAVGCGLAMALAIFCSGTVPGIWAGATFLLAWVLIGLAGTGALVSRGRRREVCVGACLMGAGFMISVFSRSQEFQQWPGFPTIQFLNSLRPWLPPAIRGGPADSYEMAITNARIRAALEHTVPMRISGMKLRDLLNFVQEATRTPDGWTIPVDVDPAGLKEAEQSLDSTISIDLEGVALKTSLKHCLRQLQLAYEVSDGLLIITSDFQDSYLREADPYLIAGQSIMAMIAVGVGGMLAPVLSDVGRRVPS